jgi:hypothetical protein
MATLSQQKLSQFYSCLTKGKKSIWSLADNFLCVRVEKWIASKIEKLENLSFCSKLVLNYFKPFFLSAFCDISGRLLVSLSRLE